MENLHIFNALSDHVLLRIHVCNEAVHPAHWVEHKQHQDYDLWIVLEGEIELKVAGQTHQASAGDLVLFNPRTMYTATSTGGCRFIYTHFSFELGSHKRILDYFRLAGIISAQLVEEELGLFMTAYRSFVEDAVMSGVRLKGCFTVLIAKIMEQYGRGRYSGQFAEQSKDRKLTKRYNHLAPVLSYIREHLDQPLRVYDLARQADMSEKYFVTYFKQIIGMTPGQYITQLRMNRARELLYRNSFSVQEIADMLGYPDPYTFSKAFKKYYGIPPSRFA